MPSLFTKGHQGSPKLQVFFYQLFNSRNTIKYHWKNNSRHFCMVNSKKRRIFALANKK